MKNFNIENKNNKISQGRGKKIMYNHKNLLYDGYGFSARRVYKGLLYHFFWGTLFLRKLYLKNFNIKNKNNKISQGRGKKIMYNHKNLLYDGYGFSARRVYKGLLYLFFWGTLFLRKLHLKNFNIKNKNNKISQGRGKKIMYNHKNLLYDGYGFSARRVNSFCMSFNY